MHAILLLVDPINCSVRSANKGGAQAPRAPPLATPLLYPYLYCVHALVGGAISIRDPYICAVHESVPMNRTLSSTGPLSVQ